MNMNRLKESHRVGGGSIGGSPVSGDAAILGPSLPAGQWNKAGVATDTGGAQARPSLHTAPFQSLLREVAPLVPSRTEQSAGVGWPGPLPTGLLTLGTWLLFLWEGSC